MNITQYRPAKVTGVDAPRGISAETALLFAHFFGNSAGFWMRLQSQYDLEKAEDREMLDKVDAHTWTGSPSQRGGHE